MTDKSHNTAPHTTRALAQQLLLMSSPHEKALAVLQFTAQASSIDVAEKINEVPGLPGRPARPPLVHPRQLKHRAVGTPPGRAWLTHALATSEPNASNVEHSSAHTSDKLPMACFAVGLIALALVGGRLIHGTWASGGSARLGWMLA